MTSQSHLCNLNQSSNQNRGTQKPMLRLRFDGVRAQYLPVAVRRLSIRSNSIEGKPGKVGRRSMSCGFKSSYPPLYLLYHRIRCRLELVCVSRTISHALRITNCDMGHSPRVMLMLTSVFSTILENSSNDIFPSLSRSASMIVLSTIC